MVELSPSVIQILIVSSNPITRPKQKESPAITSKGGLVYPKHFLSVWGQTKPISPNDLNFKIPQLPGLKRFLKTENYQTSIITVCDYCSSEHVTMDSSFVKEEGGGI